MYKYALFRYFFSKIYFIFIFNEPDVYLGSLKFYVKHTVLSDTDQMKKLHEWLLVATGLFSVWYAALTSNSALVKEWQSVILFLPIVFLLLFGLFAATVVIYRVFTFNTCENAAIELQQQIVEARKDLRNKGIIFKEISASSAS
ncbi:dolichol-phosphate mannosyltransferase subunit 3 isoform X1 [Harpegnathos saltator]|nr:dolichol-phosphate mannosyltransferase subunit 3 isoform X1 [Harpegnathos saltator]